MINARFFTKLPLALMPSIPASIALNEAILSPGVHRNRDFSIRKIYRVEALLLLSNADRSCRSSLYDQYAANARDEVARILA